MSVDFELFMEGLREHHLHMKDVFSGDTQEEEKDHSFQVMAMIPVLLSSNLSKEFRSVVLKEYAQIQGNIRDSQLAQLSRDAFYTHASNCADLEATRSDNRRSRSAKRFQVLKEYLGDDEQAILSRMEEEYTLFKEQLSLVIKSKLGIPEDREIGPKDVLEYIELEKSNLTQA